MFTLFGLLSTDKLYYWLAYKHYSEVFCVLTCAEINFLNSWQPRLKKINKMLKKCSEITNDLYSFIQPQIDSKRNIKQVIRFSLEAHF